MASHDIPVGATQVSLADLSERSRDIFRQIVESYLATGKVPDDFEPVQQAESLPLYKRLFR